jgi:hypothetical protein
MAGERMEMTRSCLSRRLRDSFTAERRLSLRAIKRGGKIEGEKLRKTVDTTRPCSTYEQVILTVSPFGAYALNNAFVTHVAEREREKKERPGHRGLITPDNDITYR